MTAVDGLRRDQIVARFIAECGDVDHREWIGRLNPQAGTCAHRRKTLARSEHWQGAIQPLEVVDFFTHVQSDRQPPNMPSRRLRKPGFGAGAAAVSSA